MKKLNKKITSMILAATMLGTALAGCGKDKLDGTQIVLTVDDYEVTLGMAHLILRENQAASEEYKVYMAQAYGVDPSAFNIWDELTEDGTTTYGEKQKETVMGSICELYAFKNHMGDYDVELTEEDYAKIEAAAKQFMEDNTQETIDVLGVSESDIATYLELITIRSKMYEPMVADVDTEVSAEESNQTTVSFVTIVTEGTEKDEDGNVIDLTEDELAKKEALAKEIIAAIQKEDDIAKADMEKIATAIDEDVEVQQSSFLTFPEEDEYDIDEAIAEAALKMKDGEVYPEVVKGENAYYVLRLDAALDKEATEDKKEEIIEERKAEIYTELAEKWVYETTTEIDYEVWAQVKLTDKQSFRYVEDEDESDEE